MTYKEADEVWTQLNEIKASGFLKGYRLVIEHVESEVLNTYQVCIK